MNRHESDYHSPENEKKNYYRIIIFCNENKCSIYKIMVNLIHTPLNSPNITHRHMSTSFKCVTCTRRRV